MAEQKSAIHYEDAFDLRKTDSIRFLLQAVMSFLVIGFCMFNLASKDGDKDFKSAYWASITGIIAWWMPTPGATGRQKNEVNTGDNSTVNYPNVGDTASTPSTSVESAPEDKSNSNGKAHIISRYYN